MALTVATRAARAETVSFMLADMAILVSVGIVCGSLSECVVVMG